MVSISPIALLIFLGVYIITYILIKKALQDLVVPLAIALGVAYYTYNLVAALVGA